MKIKLKVGYKKILGKFVKNIYVLFYCFDYFFIALP